MKHFQVQNTKATLETTGSGDHRNEQVGTKSAFEDAELKDSNPSVH